MRSAIRPAVAAPIGAADQRDGDDLGERSGADVVAVADGLDGAVDHGTVVAEEEAAHRGGRRDEDDMAEMVGVGLHGLRIRRWLRGAGHVYSWGRPAAVAGRGGRALPVAHNFTPPTT